MAQRTIKIDDLDGTSGENGDVVSKVFSFDGVTYDIDLSEQNVNELRAALAKFMKAGRPRTKPAKSQRTDKTRLHEIRTWARSHGYEFSDQGRIPKHIVEAYEKLAPQNQGKTRAGLFSN